MCPWAPPYKGCSVSGIDIFPESQCTHSPLTLHGAPKCSAPRFVTQARLPGLISYCSFWVLGSLINPPPHAHPAFPTQAGRGTHPCSGRPSGLSAVLYHEPCNREKMPATHFLGSCHRLPLWLGALGLLPQAELGLSYWVTRFT